MGNSDIALMSHLLRRAGFGASRDEIEKCLDKGYEETVEELLHPSNHQNMPDDIIRRYHENFYIFDVGHHIEGYWHYRMVTTKCPLEEKIALLWHGIFATSHVKVNEAITLLDQVDMFRRFGLGRLDDLLIELSQDPANLMWLDNIHNHKDSINENYGRELLELFSMGIGNYTEEDIKECARAFTGWTVANAEYLQSRVDNDSIWPYGRIAFPFSYREYDHDDGEKTFLGETGRFNGEDIIDIICRQPAAAKFIARHIYDFFVADEVPVPQWHYTSPRDPKAIEMMVDAYFANDHSIRSMLRVLFNSDIFKSEDVRFSRVKCPAELVVGTVRLAGGVTKPSLDMLSNAEATFAMGHELTQPISVEGWHEGIEWINGGTLMHRVNFVSKQLNDTHKPGVQAIIGRLANYNGDTYTPEQLVDNCLDIIGPIPVSPSTHKTLVDHVSKLGDISFDNRSPHSAEEKRVADLLGLIGSTREYQLA